MPHSGGTDNPQQGCCFSTEWAGARLAVVGDRVIIASFQWKKAGRASN